MKTQSITFLLVFLPFTLIAQWTLQTDLNTMVSSARTGDIQSVGTSDGKTYVAFWKDVPAPQYYEMRLQLLDADGYQLFGPEGMLVNDVLPMSSYTTIWSITVDQSDNVYIGFNATEGDLQSYVHKISPEGEQLWGPNGVIVGSGFDVKVLPMSDGGAIVSWLPDAGKGFFQKFDEVGNPVWPNPVTIEPIVPTHSTAAGEMAELSDGGILMLFHDRSGFSVYGLFHAQRYDANGAALWTAPVPVATASSMWNRRYSIEQEGDVVFLGYTGSIGLAFYSYVQRIEPDGTLPWGVSGSIFTTDYSYYQRDTEMASEKGSPFIWSVCEYTTTSQGEIGEYVQKFDKETGARLLGDEAKEVFSVNEEHRSHRGSLQLIDDQPVIMLSTGYNNGASPVHLVVAYLDGNGDFVWPEKYREIATYDAAKGRFDFTRPYDGQCVGVWTEERTEIGESRAFAQNIVVVDCPTATPGFDYGSADLTATFSSTAIGADSTAWDFGDGVTGAGENATHTYADGGTYTVCQYVFNDCGVDSLCQDITVTSTGTEEPVTLSGLEIYPNPSSGDFSIGMETEEALIVSYTVYALDGRPVFISENYHIQGKQMIPYQGPVLAPGSYFIRLMVGEQGTDLPWTPSHAVLFFKGN